MPVIKADSPGHRYSAFSVSDIEQEAAALLAEAQRRADGLIRQTRQQADSERGRAFELGLAEGREQGRREGIEEGIAQGRQQAYEERAARVDELLRTLETSLKAFEAERAALADSAATDVTRLAIAIAERVCKRAGRFDPDVCAQNAAAALRLVMRSNDVKLLANPDDLEHLRTLIPDFQRRWPALTHIELVGDPAIERGGCRVATVGGLVDAELRTQLDRVAADLVPGADAQG